MYILSNARTDTNEGKQRIERELVGLCLKHN